MVDIKHRHLLTSTHKKMALDLKSYDNQPSFTVSAKLPPAASWCTVTAKAVHAQKLSGTVESRMIKAI